MLLSKKFFFLFIGLITFTSIVLYYQSLKPQEPELKRINLKITLSKKSKLNTSYIPTIYRGDCKVMTIDSLIQYGTLNKFQNGVPKILHYISNEEDIAKTYTEFYKNCGFLNKDMRMVLWTDASFFTVFVTKFSGNVIDKWRSTFANLEDPVRTTIMRAMVLYIFGGVSISLDTLCQKPISTIMTGLDCFVSVGDKIRASVELEKENDFGDFVFGCMANHVFLNSLITNRNWIKPGRTYLTQYVEHFDQTNRAVVSKLNNSMAEEIFPKLEMKRICGGNKKGAKLMETCNIVKYYTPNDKSKSVLVHKTQYEVLKYQIVADDICHVGIPLHIVIL